MPTGVYVRTKEMRENNSKAQEGKHLSQETRGKMSIAHKDKHLSEETKQKISRAHIGISPWNKDKIDIYSEDTICKMSKAAMGNKRSLGHHHTEISRKKMSKTQKKIAKKRFAKMIREKGLQILKPWILAGQKASQTLEAKQKRNKTIRENFAKMTKREKRERLKYWIEAGHRAAQKANPSSIEKMVWQVLDKFNIDYKTQVSFDNHKFLVDIYIPAQRLIIECNGDYWHNLPFRKKRDEKLAKFVAKNGYKLIWLWEHDIRRNPRQALQNELKFKEK